MDRWPWERHQGSHPGKGTELGARDGAEGAAEGSPAEVWGHWRRSGRLSGKVRQEEGVRKGDGHPGAFQGQAPPWLADHHHHHSAPG